MQREHDDENDTHLLNLTGSPLKDSCQIELLNLSITEELLPKKNAWNNDEEQYQSIAMDEAQYVYQYNFLYYYSFRIFSKKFIFVPGNTSWQLCAISKGEISRNVGPFVM